MSLSKAKRKYIRRLAGKKKPSEIAHDLKIPEHLVEQELADQAGVQSKGVPSPELGTKALPYSRHAPLPLVLVLATLVGASLVNLEALYRGADLPKAALVEVGSLSAFTALLVQGAIRGKLRLFSCPLYLPLALFLAWGCATLLWARIVFDGLTVLVHWLCCALALVVTVQAMMNGRSMARVILLGTLSFCGAFVSLIGIFQYLGGVDWFLQAVPPASTFGNKNMAAQVVLPAIPASFALLLRSRRYAWMWTFAGLLTLQTLFLFYSFTRAAWLGLVMAVVVVILFLLLWKLRLGKSPWTNRRHVMACCASAVLVLIFIHLTPDGWEWRERDILRRMTSGAKSGEAVLTAAAGEPDSVARGASSISIRITAYRNVFHLMGHHGLFGIGVDNFKSYLHGISREGIKVPQSTFSLMWRRAHSDPLQIAVEFGIVAIVLFAWYLTIIGRWMVKLLRTLPNEEPERAWERRLFGMATLAGIAGVAVNACFSFPLYNAMPPLILACLHAVLFRAAGAASGTGASSLSEGFAITDRRVLGTAAVGMLLLAALWGIVHYHWIIADKHYHTMHVHARLEEFEKAAEWGERSRRWNPYRNDTRFMLGQAYLKFNELQKARDHLETHLASFPSFPKTLLLLGRCYQLLGNFAGAEEPLQRAIEVAPLEARNYELLGSVQGSLGKHEAALTTLQRAVELEPDNPTYHFNLGLQARAAKQFDTVVESFSRTIALDPDYSPAQLNLGLALFLDLQRFDEGVAPLERFLELDPRHGKAGDVRAMLEDYRKFKEAQGG